MAMLTGLATVAKRKTRKLLYSPPQRAANPLHALQPSPAQPSFVVYTHNSMHLMTTAFEKQMQAYASKRESRFTSRLVINNNTTI